MQAACKLVKQLNPQKIMVNFLIELEELNGKAVFDKEVEVASVLTL